MTNTRLLARNTALNLFGQIAPLSVALVAVPVLINALGKDQFGILNLAWTLIGYFGLFDFGMARALTQAASESLGSGDQKRLSETGAVAIGAMFALGVLGAIALAALTPWLAHSFLTMDDALRPDAAMSFFAIAVSLPFVLSTLGLRGLFEAHQHFGLATALRMPYALFNFIGPLLVLPFSHSLVPIVWVLVAGRVVMWGAHLVFGMRRYPWLRTAPMRNVGAIVPLLRVGSWMTVTNIVSPLMVNLDRFITGALLTVAVMTYYTTPFDVVTKLLFVPAAILGVSFPAFASAYLKDRGGTAAILERSAKLVLALVFPVVLVVVAVGHEGLNSWVGPDFAQESTLVLQILAVGVFINSVGQVPFALLQAIRRPDLTAKVHMVELPLYVVMIYFLTKQLGLAGVALAWTIRITIDAVVLSWLTNRLLPEAGPALRRMSFRVGALSCVLGAFSLPAPFLARAAGASVLLVIFLPIAWLKILDPAEREVVLDLVRWRRRPAARPT